MARCQVHGHFFAKSKWETFWSVGNLLFPNKGKVICQYYGHIPELSVVLLVILSNKESSQLSNLFTLLGVYAFYKLPMVDFSIPISLFCVFNSFPLDTVCSQLRNCNLICILV